MRVNTVDFITPPVDDPYWFGQISAANSISDVYAMGVKPLTALNVVMFPSKQLDMGLLREILRGGHDKTVEAGACLVGGHTVDDEEPKYGLCVNGTVHPDRIITNADLERDILPLLAALNGPAIDAALQFNLHACTVVTGFGILGHLLEVAHGCDAKIVVKYQNLPFFPYALDMYRKGESTGSNKANRVMVHQHNLEIRSSLDSAQEEMLYDPQTSGGLLLSLPNSEADALLKVLHKTGVTDAVKIGEVVDEPVGIVVA